MPTLAYVLRIISLSFLFGGSTAIVFAAITLVKSAHAAGVPIPEAAAANAPMFYMYSTVVIVCALALLAAEAIDFMKARAFKLSNLTKARYASSALCIIAAIVLKAAIIPQMKQLAPNVKTNQAAHASFQKLHSVSRIDFSIIIVCSLVSLLLPCFEQRKQATEVAPESPVASA